MLPGGNKRIENCPWAIQSMCGNSSVHCRCFDCVTKLGMHMLQTKRAHTQSYSHLFYPHFFVCECKCMSIGQQQIIVVIWTADASPQILSKHFVRHRFTSCSKRSSLFSTTVLLCYHVLPVRNWMHAYTKYVFG